MSKGVKSTIGETSSVGIVSQKLFSRQEIEAFEGLLSNRKITEHEAARFFAEFPKFLWFQGRAEIRREVALLRQDGEVRRVDFFKRTLGKRSWDLIELKSPQQSFLSGVDTKHVHLSAAVHRAISQAQDYRDWMVENVNLREKLAGRGIIVCRPQIIVLVGQAAEAVPPDMIEVLCDRVRSSGVEAHSYSDVLAFAKESYRSDRILILPGQHYSPPSLERPREIEALLDEVSQLFGLAGAILYILDVNSKSLRACAYHGVSLPSSTHIADFVHPLDKASLAARVVLEKRAWFVPRPELEPRLNMEGIRRFNIQGPLFGIPLLFEDNVLGCLIGWQPSGSTQKRDLIDRFVPFCQLLASVVATSQGLKAEE